MTIEEQKIDLLIKQLELCEITIRSAQQTFDDMGLPLTSQLCQDRIREIETTVTLATK